MCSASFAACLASASTLVGKVQQFAGGDGPIARQQLLQLQRVAQPRAQKRLERLAKTVLKGRFKKELRNGMSAIAPTAYRERFLAGTAYQLTLDNDGDPFVWTSNFQVISKVYLKKHASRPRTYLLNKKDRKMVQQGMAKMVEPQS